MFGNRNKNTKSKTEGTIESTSMNSWPKVTKWAGTTGG